MSEQTYQYVVPAVTFFLMYCVGWAVGYVIGKRSTHE
jgi:hypothetical protein